MRLPILVIACALVAPASAAGGAEHADQTEPDRILVTIADPGVARKIRSGAPRPGYGRFRSRYLASPGVRKQARELAQRYPMQIVEEWPIVPLGVHCIVYAVDNGQQVESLLEKIRNEADIESAQAMHTFEVNGSVRDASADPYAHVQHSIDILGLEEAHRWSTGEGIRIAIIDTGADLEHADLADQVDEFRDFVNGGSADSYRERHGTAIAGVIAARRDNAVGIVGVAPAARASILRACWYPDEQRVARCNTLTIAKALAHAIDIRADVINLSLGGPSDRLLERLAEAAMQNGAVIVSAAPPPPVSVKPFPSSLRGVIAVREYEMRASSGLRLPMLLAAPGVDILVLLPNDGYDFASGSSLAAAHVTGIVSLLLAYDPDLSTADVTELLSRSRENATGSVHACRALAALSSELECRQTPGRTAWRKNRDNSEIAE